MKKIIIYIILLVFAHQSIQSQTLTQSADGKSSIPLPLKGMGLSVDIGKSEIAFGLNNYQKVLKDSAKFLIGGNLSAKNAEGLGNLFSSGDIVPAGNLLAFAGFSFSNNKTLIDNFNKSSAILYHRQEMKMQDEIFSEYKNKTLKYVLAYADKIPGSDKERQDAVNELKGEILKCKDTKEVTEKITGFKKGNNNFLEYVKVLLEKNAINVIDFTTAFNLIRENYSKVIDNTFTEYLKSQNPMRLTVFLQGGIQARSFTRYLGLNATDLPKSFQDTLYRGGLLGLGVNFQFRNYWFGITYSYNDGDNFLALKSKEYTIKTTDNNSNQQLTSEKKYTAYSGKYAKVETNELNLDLVGDFKIGDTSRMLVNLYGRASLFSRDTAYLKNYFNIGAGFYFLSKKAKFIGGLYVELPDVNNNFEKAKPANEINIRSPFRKLTFGIVTKFNLSSIFAFANRPAKSD